MRWQLIQHEIAALIAEARRIGLTPEELKRAIDNGWEKSGVAVEAGR